MLWLRHGYVKHIYKRLAYLQDTIKIQNDRIEG
jgi:hypothetical protein